MSNTGNFRECVSTTQEFSSKRIMNYKRKCTQKAVSRHHIYNNNIAIIGRITIII